MRLLQRSTSANAAGRSPGYGQTGQNTFDSAYDDDAFDDLEGYGSGDDGGGFEMTKVRLKVRVFHLSVGSGSPAEFLVLMYLDRSTTRTTSEDWA